MSRTNKGVPVKFYKTDRYIIRIDAENISDEKHEAIIALLKAIYVDWWEGYVHTLETKK